MTEARSAMRHFTTTAFGPAEKVAACHEVYGRTIAKIDLEPADDHDLMVDAKLRSRPGLGLVSMTSTEFRFRKPARLIDKVDTKWPGHVGLLF
jgi:hypothetical protein